MHVTICPLSFEDIPGCIAINRSLPKWFGQEDGLAEAEGYLHEHTGLVAVENGAVVGYLTWQRLFPGSSEISWMAVAKSQHRKGIGRALVAALEKHLPGNSLLSVKTLDASHPSPEYAATRAFYRAVGFEEQMAFPDLWGISNPCLLMVKTVN